MQQVVSLSDEATESNLSKSSSDVSTCEYYDNSCSNNRKLGVLPGLLHHLFRSNPHKANYAIADLEHRIYSIQHHDSSTRLLQQDRIISTDEDEASEGVLRCFTDRRATYAATVLILNVLCTLTVAPISFMWASNWREEDGFLLAVDIMSDVLYAMYLLLQLNMSFMHPTRRVEVTSRSKILMRWLCDPLYLVMWVSATTYFWIMALDAPLLLNNIKLVRLAHLMTLPDALWTLQDVVPLRLGRALLLLFCGSHWVACVLVWGGGYHEAQVVEDPLVFKGEPLAGTCKLKLYLTALVESIYMLTGAMDNPLGVGGPREDNLGSLVLVSIFGPVGCVIVAVLIAAICREQALTFALEIRHEESMAFVKRALENLNIPSELRRRVESLHYFQRMSHDTEALRQLFDRNNLSRPLDDAIRVYLYRNVLCSPFFVTGGPNYLLAVVRVLEDRMYLPGDYVVRRGEVGGEMFFIDQGEVVVLVPSPDCEDVANAVAMPGRRRKGQYFGEVALVQRVLRTAWVRAETYVVASVLHRGSIEDIWYFFPAERKALVEAVEETRERDRQRVHRQRWEAQLDDDDDDLVTTPSASGQPSSWSDGSGEASMQELLRTLRTCHAEVLGHLQNHNRRLEALELGVSRGLSQLASAQERC